MSLEPAPGRGSATGNATLGAGVVVALAMIVAFLWGESHDVDTTPLLAILSPVVGALFLVPKVAAIERNTEQVQRQTNGHLTSLSAELERLRIENAELRAGGGPGA